MTAPILTTAGVMNTSPTSLMFDQKGLSITGDLGWKEWATQKCPRQWSVLLLSFRYHDKSCIAILDIFNSSLDSHVLIPASEKMDMSVWFPKPTEMAIVGPSGVMVQIKHVGKVML